jgi:taurine transport system substrate-binding protein
MMSKFGDRRKALGLMGSLGVCSVLGGSVIGMRSAYAQARKHRITASTRPVPESYILASGGWAKALPAGVGIETTTVASGAQIMAALASGSADISNVGSTPMLTGICNGLDVSVVYVHSTTLTSEGLVVRNDSGINSVADLRGKTVGVTFNTSTHFALLAALSVTGVPVGEVKLINARADTLPALWQRGEIAASYTWSPIVNQLEKDNGKRIFQSGDLVKHGILAFDAICVRNDYKKNNPDLVMAHLTEYVRVSRLFQQGHPDLAPTLSKFTQVPENAVREFIKNFATLTPQQVVSKEWMGRPGETDAGIYKSLAFQANFMKQLGQVQSVPASFTPYVDSSFAVRLAA